MDETAPDDGEIFEAVGYPNHFSDLTDGRQAERWWIRSTRCCFWPCCPSLPGPIPSPTSPRKRQIRIVVRSRN